MSVKCIIVDDEQLARQLLESYVQKIPELTLSASCKNPIEAMEVMRTEEIALVYTDIQMPELLGTEMLRSMKNKPVAIFTTAYKEYALEGYELDAVDYLLKPISFERFLQATNKALELIQLKNSTTPPKTSDEFLVLKSGTKTHKIKISDISYIEGLKEYISYYVNGERIVVLESLKNLEETLPGDQFLRVHKSYIVNYQKVRSMESNSLDIDGKKVPIGKSYKSIVLQKVFNT